MTEMSVEKTLIIFWGWSKTDNSDRRLLETTPNGWNVIPLSFPDLINGHNFTGFDQKVINLMDKQRLSQAYIAGHSLGGALAIEFAATHPDLVKNFI